MFMIGKAIIHSKLNYVNVYMKIFLFCVVMIMKLI